MTTAISINTDELLKRKIGALTNDELLHGGPNYKILRRTPSEQLSDISLSEEHTFAFEEDSEDDEEDMNDIGDTIADRNGENNNDSKPNQSTKDNLPQQSAPTQRKKPGRKPNPASPALRKEQNRAAQRAFRERKERHLKDLENTIQSLRVIQTETANKFQREREHLRSLIERVEVENYYLKYIALNFECALNSIYGNCEATTKIKNSVLSSIPRFSLSNSLLAAGDIGNFDSFDMVPSTITAETPIGLNESQTSVNQQQLQLQLPTLNVSGVGDSTASFILPSPANSSVVLSPKSANVSSPASAISSPPTPDLVQSDSISVNGPYLAANMKSFTGISTNSNTPNANAIYQKLSDQLLKSLMQNQISSQLENSSAIVSTNDNSDSSFISVSPLIQDPSNLLDSSPNTFNTAFILSGDAESLKGSHPNFDIIQATREVSQLIRLAKLVGCTDLSVPVKPKLKRPMTQQQAAFLNIPHDQRIDLIPCYHLRSRMIQYQGQYDLYELCELLIGKAKCHGDPLDPDSWECPKEFFEKYPFLVFQHCRLKSDFYQQFGKLPPNFDNIYQEICREK
ncbi:8799_t:CDS:1, partial [Acaulospora morrowiae]